MIDILIKAFGFILIIVIGFLLKSKGICKREHGQFLSTIIMNITLPCALLSSINNLEITPVLLIALLIGFLGNVITNVAGYFITAKETPMNRALAMINMSGYNIGTFTLPFVQSFFPASAIAYVCLFDTGNALMCLGGTFTAASVVVSTDEKPTFHNIIKKLFSSIPFCTYIVLFFLSLFHIAIPNRVLMVTSIAGNANAFLAMLMIGIMLEIKLDFSEIKTIKKRFIDDYLLNNPNVTVDYVHGNDALESIGKQEGNCGIRLGAIDKNSLFPAIQAGGVLPRKTFSMGEAHEKRYYMECRRIIK